MNSDRKPRNWKFDMSKRRITVAAMLFVAIALVPIVRRTAVVADQSVGPVPPTTNPVTLQAAPVNGVGDGQAVTFSVATSGTAKLVGPLTVHLCQHGFGSYAPSTFGYDGKLASRCVFAGNIVAGGLTGADYEKTFGPYAGTETNSGDLTFNVGSGSVTWGNNSGYGPFQLDAYAGSPVDLVVQVNLVGDDVPVTYFVQPIDLSAPAPTTTTTSSTTTSTTTTTTTTTIPATTTTTVPATAPAAPGGVVAKPGSTRSATVGPILVGYTTPANHGATITKYTATCTSNNGGHTVSAVYNGATAATITVNNATLKRHYTCTVKATNAKGTSAASKASVTITVGAPAQVGKPTLARAGGGKLRVSFTNLSAAQANGAALIAPQYTATCTSTNGGVKKTGNAAKSPVIVAGLSTGKTYTCTVNAHNSRGYSVASPASATGKP